MFAAMAGESGCRPEEIAAMAAALPGRSELLSRADPTHAVWIDTSAAFAAATRGLPVLPEDPLDTRPDVDRELVFVCRARLDDRAGLLQLLQIEGAYGATLSDAQILRRCYQRWREETPRFVYGDFAFVAWERWSRRTVAATDHLGNFPLFYCRSGGRLLFATQLGALLACPNVRAKLDPLRLKRAAAGQPIHGGTMFEGIEVLQGGHLLVHHEEMLRVEKWWCPDTAARDVHAHARDYVDEARILFDAAVASRLRARGGVISASSGALDSALVTVTAARQLSASGKLLETLTAVPRDDAVWASEVADFHPNIRQRLVSTDDMTALDVLPLAHEIAHTPVLNPANLLWAWKMSAYAAHNRVRVILCADRGNRSIGYAGDLCDAHFIPLRRLAGAAQQTWDRVRCIGTGPDARMGTDTRMGIDTGTNAADGEHSESRRQMFAREMLAPRTTTRVDFMTRFGVEWLDPTADRKLLERLLTFPLHLFRVGNRPRGLARELGRGRLPESVRLRRAQVTPSADLTAWVVQRAGDYRRALQGLRESDTCTQILDLPGLDVLLDTLSAGNGTATQAATLHQALDVGLFALRFGGPGRLVLERPVQRDDMLSGVRNGSAQVRRPAVAASCPDGLDSVPGERLMRGLHRFEHR